MGFLGDLWGGVVDTVGGAWDYMFGSSDDDDSGPSSGAGAGGDSQSQGNSGSNKGEQGAGGDSGNAHEVKQSTGDADARYGTSGATTTISPSTTINPQSEVRGQSQAQNQTNASAQLEGSQHNEVVGTYSVQAPQQNISVPVMVDMSDSADTSSANQTELSGSTVAVVTMAAAAVAGLYLLRRPEKPRRRSGRRKNGKRRAGNGWLTDS